MPAATARKKYEANPQRDMQKELAAAGALKDQLQKVFGEDDDDATLLRDTIEGQTNLLEMFDSVLERIAADRELIAGIKIMADKRAARKKRLEDRVSLMETMLLSALTILEEKRVERPIALIFTRQKPDKLDVTDEAAIPSLFYETPDPVLSNANLLQALKDRAKTLEQKHDEITDRVKAGEMTEEGAAEAREAIEAAFPPIPGAELIAGGTGITVKWS